MGSTITRTAAFLLATVALTAAPSFAQRDGRGDGDRAVERARPRDEGRRGSRDRDRGDQARRVEPRRVEPNRRYDDRRDDNRRSDNRRFDNRRYDNRRYDTRRYDRWSYRDRPYVFRPYRNRSYVIPYGYRPYGYRPGWSLDLYFGRPYGCLLYTSPSPRDLSTPRMPSSA